MADTKRDLITCRKHLPTCARTQNNQKVLATDILCSHLHHRLCIEI